MSPVLSSFCGELPQSFHAKNPSTEKLKLSLNSLALILYIYKLTLRHLAFLKNANVVGMSLIAVSFF